MRAWMDVALLGKTRNKDGRLVVRSAAGLPFLLEEGMEVAFVPPQTDLPRRARVMSARMTGERVAEVRFEGVGPDEAAGLVGCHCLVRRDSFDESLLGEEPVFWEGWQVIDEHAGFVGVVAGLLENPGQDLLVVRRLDCGAELLVPLVDDIVRDVRPASRELHVALPAGLLDL